MHDAIRAELDALAEPAYQRFNSRLIPGVENLLGVRTPHLRKIAKRLAKGDWQAYLATARDDSYEEILLQGLVLGYAKASWQELAPWVARFIPKITNWAVCDLFCGSIKQAKASPEEAWAFTAAYFGSTSPYEIRFAVVMALNYFLGDAYLDEVIAYLDAIRHDDYYVKMGVAWTLSMAYVEQPERVLPYLQKNNLDDWTHNKALQKIIESLQVSEETRQLMRGLKR